MEKKTVALLVVLISVCLKVLLIPSYTSTDFEVHRNWLAITYSLPLQEWYFENTSIWTLDYPPFFAWFEKGLSQVAVHIDPAMVNISSLEHKSDETLLFQRSSVIVTDLVLAYASYNCANLNLIPNFTVNKQMAFFCLIVLNCGLFIVDHIHFQYNGFLFGIMFLSLGSFIHNSYYRSAFWFAVLLNFKHIFLYIAPAFGIFFVRLYCIKPFTNLFNMIRSLKFSKLLVFAIIVLTVLLLSFGPFFTNLDQVFKRLFPFKRGLTHAYWAPNFWALYNVLDRVLAMVGKKLGFISKLDMASSTGGIVHTVNHVVLPSISPSFTFLLTFFSMMPCLLKVFFKPKLLFSDQFNEFLRTIVLCSMCSFMFGWHVHEKAILMAILPSTLLALSGTERDARFFLFLQTVGHYSLFPLLFTQFESVTKLCLLLFYSFFAYIVLGGLYKSNSKYLPCLNNNEAFYLFGLIAIEVFASTIFPFFSIFKHYEFLPLLLISTYCALGISWSWINLYANILTS